MENTAQTSAISRRTRGTRCNRTLRAPNQPTATASKAPSRQRRAWLTKLDKTANQNERAMLFWLDTAARYHTDPVRDVIVALKTVEAPASHADAPSVLYVWEVAWCRDRDGIKWQFIVWDVSGYGVRFHDCASRDEAMALYALPVAEVIAATRQSPGVYLCPESRPV